MSTRRLVFSASLALGVYVAVAGCGDDDTAPPAADAGVDAVVDVSVPDAPADVTNDRGGELTGQSCKAPTDCYQGLDAQSLAGEVRCLDRVTNGYCTHLCDKDEDCCAVPGECKTGLKQVCAPFESTGEKYCFLSCEPDDIAAAEDAGVDAGATDDEYCKREASSEFGCRSTGGGNQNRKVCLPTGAPGDAGTDGASDAAGDAPADAPQDG